MLTYWLIKLPTDGAVKQEKEIIINIVARVK